jgi:hypothetical protein
LVFDVCSFLWYTKASTLLDKGFLNRFVGYSGVVEMRPWPPGVHRNYGGYTFALFVKLLYLGAVEQFYH